MSIGDYAAGAGLLLLTAGALAAAAALVTMRRLPALRGSAAAAAFGLLTATGLVLAHLAPLALGALSRLSVLLAALALLGGAVLATRRPPADAPARPDAPPPRSDTASRAIAALAALIAGGFVLAYARSEATRPVVATDTLTFDLPMIGRWLQDASVWAVHDFFPHQSHGSYPHNGDVPLLALILPWDSDFAVRFAQYPALALLAVALYALAREVGAPRAPAVLAATVCLSIHSVLFPALWGAMPDTFMLAAFTAGTLFLVRQLRTGARADLLLGGLGLGLAAGTKWYGPPSVLVLVAGWLTVSLVRRRSLPSLVRDTGLLAAVGVAAAAFWLVRNWVAYDNPLFPVELAPFGLTILDAPPDVERERLGFSIADYLGDPAVIDTYMRPAWWTAVGVTAPLLLATAAVTLVARVDGRRRMLAACALAIGVVYLFTPYTALGLRGAPLDVEVNVRYLVPALVLATPLFAVAASARDARLRLPLQLAGLVAVCVGLRNARLEVGPATLAAATLALAALGGAAWWLAPRVRDAVHGWPPRRVAAAAAAIAAAALLVAAVAGRVLEERFADGRYGEDAALAALAQAPRPASVGVTGTWDLDGPPPVWPAYGPGLDNEVEYLGRIDRGWLVPHSEEAAWRRAASRHDLVLVGRMPTREAAWARRAGFTPVARSPRFVLYRP